MTNPISHKPRSVPHNWTPGDYGWFLTTAISQQPILVRIVANHNLSKAVIPIVPVRYGPDQTLSDGTYPAARPDMAFPSDLFQHYDAAFREMKARCRSAIFELLQDATPAGGR